MFITKTFSDADVTEPGLLDAWLNALAKPGYAVRVVSQVVIPDTVSYSASVITTTTVSTWKISDAPGNAATRATIDDMPEDPSIDLDEVEDSNV